MTPGNIHHRAEEFLVQILCFPSRLFRREGGGRLEDFPSILVLKLDALGDFVLATPFLKALRRSAPRARITLVTSPVAASLAAQLPWSDRQAVLPRLAGIRRLGMVRRLFEIRSFLKNLDGYPFDLALIPRTGPDLYQAHTVARLSGATRITRFSPSGHPPALQGGSADICLPYPGDLHEAEANLLLLHPWGVEPGSASLELACSATEREEADRLLHQAGLDAGTKWVAFGVGAGLPVKCWPAEKFMDLAVFFQKLSHKIVILGDAGDRDRFPVGGGHIYNWAGVLSPAQSWHILRSARLFVGNDSGAMHLAAAARCPVVVVHWQGNPDVADDVNSHRRFAPHGVPHRMVFPGPDTGTPGAHAVGLDEVQAACAALLTETAQ